MENGRTASEAGRLRRAVTRQRDDENASVRTKEAGGWLSVVLLRRRAGTREWGGHWIRAVPGKQPAHEGWWGRVLEKNILQASIGKNRLDPEQTRRRGSVREAERAIGLTAVLVLLSVW